MSSTSTLGRNLKALVPMAHVRDVARSLDFYARLGFEEVNRHSDQNGRLLWIDLQQGQARLMLNLTDSPVEADGQAVLFYLYYEDIAGTHRQLAEQGLRPGPLTCPFYCPRGEFLLLDPDGHCLMLAHS